MYDHIENLEQLDSPALIIYPERVRHNISLAIQMIGDVQRLRPHVKTHKSAEVTRLMLDAGIRKFKCATIAEAEMLGMCGAPDVLLAYQPVGPKLQRLIAVITEYPATRFSCLTDSAPAAQAIANAAATRQIEIPVYIDLNIGQNRTGIAPEAALDLFAACAAMKGILPVGLHAYDGHIRDLDWETRKISCDMAFSRVTALRDAVVQAGYPEPVIVAGGSPTYSIHAKREQVECSPGTFIYWDKGYGDLCPEQAFQTAAVLITRVVSLPDSSKICLDLGHKSVAAENPVTHRVFFPDAPELIPLSQSEEHLVLEAGTGHSWKIGDVIYGIPFHVCPTVALYERTYTIENQQITGEWRTLARDKKIRC